MLLALSLACFAPQGNGPLERTAYVSTDLSLRLVVDPTERRGQGAGWYRLSQSDEVRWQGRLPFTLQSALVTNSGVVVGYAFTHGQPSGDGHLLVVCIDEHGTARVVDAEERRSPEGPDGPCRPIVSKLELRGGEERFGLRVSESRRSGAWSYAIDAPSTSALPWSGWTWTVKPAEPPSVAGELRRVDVGAMASIDLEELEPVVLGGDAQRPFVVRAQSAAITTDGGYAVLDKDRVVWSFDSRGTVRARTLLDERADFGNWRSAFLAGARGGCALECGEFWIELDALGRSVEVCDVGRYAVYRQRRPVLSGMQAGSQVSFDVWAAELREDSGRITTRFERGADQRWIDSCTDAAVTANGWAGVLDWRTGERASERSTWLHLYDPAGVVRRSLDLGALGSVRTRRLRAAGDRFLDDRPGIDALLVDPERDELRVFRPVAVGGGGSRIVAVVPSMDGESIAVFESGWAVVRRFAWPSDG